ncbi:hypothetical protein HGRIS_002380 [Hohenbuehelia grisea]|uniref:Uncharacterized protein n=1 Tax=Hohenbuehelia grisea TaxID=104357 RepID=A0ABR3JKA8_9AGAR
MLIGDTAMDSEKCTLLWMYMPGIHLSGPSTNSALMNAIPPRFVAPAFGSNEAEEKAFKVADFSKTQIQAVFVFHDPRNWSLDIQVICDVIQSGGIIGGPYEPADKQNSPVELIFCNPDLLWRSDFDMPRLGQGAFKTAFQGVYKALTGSEYPYVQYGKPTAETYQYAAQTLRDLLKEKWAWSGPLPPVYMVGDNPESDIAGANAAHWPSVLVGTGVYDPQQGPPSHPPTHMADDVESAVLWAMSRELGGKV